MVTLTAVFSVYLIVGSHNRPGLRFLYRRLEACQINLPHGSFICGHIYRHPPGLLIVHGKMFETGADPLALYANDVAFRHLGGKIRILRKILKIPSAKGTSFDIGSGPQQYGYLLLEAFFPQRFSDFPNQLLIPAVGDCRRGRKAGRRYTFIDPQMIRFLRLLAQAMGSVRHHNAGNFVFFHFFRKPERRSLAQTGFLFQSKILNQFV